MTPGGSVGLEFPAQSGYLRLARSVAAAMAAEAELTLDQLDDARLGVDEAVAQVLEGAAEGSRIRCEFEVDATGLRAVISAPTHLIDDPSTRTFGWTVLAAVCDEARARVADGRLEVALHLRRAVVGA